MITYRLNIKTLYNRIITHGIYKTYADAEMTAAVLLMAHRINNYYIVPEVPSGYTITGLKSRLLKIWRT